MSEAKKCIVCKKTYSGDNCIEPDSEHICSPECFRVKQIEDGKISLEAGVKFEKEINNKLAEINEYFSTPRTENELMTVFVRAYLKVHLKELLDLDVLDS